MNGGGFGGGGGPGGGGPGGGGPGGGARRRGRRGKRGGRRRQGFGGPPAFGGGGGGGGGFGGGGGGGGFGGPRPQSGLSGGTSPEDRGLSGTPAGDRLLLVKIAHDGPIPAMATDRGISPFALFAACILGVTESDGFRTPNAHDVARRFGLAPGPLVDLLKALALDVDSLKQSGFDVTGAQMDVQVAPTGVSRTEIAKDLYKDLLALPKRAEVVAAAASRKVEPPPAVVPGPSEDAAGGGVE